MLRSAGQRPFFLGLLLLLLLGAVVVHGQSDGGGSRRVALVRRSAFGSADLGESIRGRMGTGDEWEFMPCSPLPPVDALRRVEAVLLLPHMEPCDLEAVAAAVGNRTRHGKPPLLQSIMTGLPPGYLDEVPAEFGVANLHQSTVPLAEWVLAAMLSDATGIDEVSRRFRECTWRSSAPGNTPCPDRFACQASRGNDDPGSICETHELLFGRSMCILGYGSIGAAVAQRAAAFGVQIRGTTLHPPPEAPAPLESLGDSSRAAAELCSTGADYLVVALPLTRDTEGIVDGALLELLSPAAMLLNPARAGVVDEQALFDRLSSGALRSAALDVWWQGIDAPCPACAAAGVSLPWKIPNATSPSAWPSRLRFDALDNVIMTPHTASSSSFETTTRLADAAAQLDRITSGERPLNMLRPGVISWPDPEQAAAADAATPSLHTPLEECESAVQTSQLGAWSLLFGIPIAFVLGTKYERGRGDPSSMWAKPSGPSGSREERAALVDGSAAE